MLDMIVEIVETQGVSDSGLLVAADKLHNKIQEALGVEVEYGVISAPDVGDFVSKSPDGADLLIVGQLLIATTPIIKSVVHDLVDLLKEWINQYAGRRVRIRQGDLTIELTGKPIDAHEAKSIAILIQRLSRAEPDN